MQKLRNFIVGILFTGISVLLFPGCLNTSDVYNMEGIVEISYNDIDIICDTEEYCIAAERILSVMQEGDDILLSFAVDSAILIEDSELGKYDHLVMTNSKWIDMFGTESNLVPVVFDKLHVEMQAFLTEQMPLLTADGSILPEGIELYEYIDDSLLVYPTNVKFGAKPLKSKKPLILLVENPSAVLNSKGCLLPLTSSGNVMFTDEEKLKRELADSIISPYILSIDEIREK